MAHDIIDLINRNFPSLCTFLDVFQAICHYYFWYACECVCDRVIQNACTVLLTCIIIYVYGLCYFSYSKQSKHSIF